MSDLPELVIQRILGYLDVLDVGRCRELCKSWNLTATQCLEDRIDEVQKRIIPRKPRFTEIAGWLFLATQTNNVEWSNYYLSNFDLGLGVGNQLFSRVGENMRILKLAYCDQKEKKKKKHLITTSQLGNILRNKAPFLEELELEFLPAEVKKYPLFLSSSPRPELELRKVSFWVLPFEQGYSEAFLKSLFMAAPNLETLSINSHWPEVMLGTENLELGSILSGFLMHGKLENLKDLVLETVSNSSMSLLASKVGETQLRKFYVDIFPEDYDANVLHQILVSRKDTLESLNLGFHVFRLPKFPTMVNLTKLTMRVSWSISGLTYSYDDRPCCYFDWAEQFPQLVSLVLLDTGTKDADGFDLCELFHDEATPCLTVKNLEIPPELDPDLFENVVRIFPNLLKLVVAFQTKEKNFSYIFSSWPNLKTLVLSTFYFGGGWSVFGDSDSSDDEEQEDGDPGATEPKKPKIQQGKKKKKKKVRRSFDSLLTGIPDTGLKLMQQAYDAGAPLSHEEIEAKRKFPSLLNLPNLNHLIFHDQWLFQKYARARTRLSDLTVKLALEKMKDLKSLLIPKHATKITPACFQKFCADLDLKENPHIKDGRYFVKYDWQMRYKDDFEIFHKSIPDYQ